MNSVPDASRPTDAARDHATIQGALAGDVAAGERLGERLRAVPRILVVLNSRWGSPLTEHDLEDLSQDVLMILWRKLDQFQGVGTLEAWLYRFCSLELCNRLRRENRRTATVKLSPSIDPPGAAPAGWPVSPAMLEASLAELGEPDEEIVRRKHYDGLSFEELGRALGISPNTAKTRYYRGIRWLRQRLSRGLEEVRR